MIDGILTDPEMCDTGGASAMSSSNNTNNNNNSTKGNNGSTKGDERYTLEIVDTAGQVWIVDFRMSTPRNRYFLEIGRVLHHAGIACP